MRRIAALAALLCLTALGAPADAAAPSRLVIRGSGPVMTEITLRAATTLQVGGFDRATSMGIKGRGQYAGFVLQHLDGTVVVGGVVVRGFEVDGQQVPLVFGQGFEAVRVPRGRYRLTLVSDGPSEVTIPAPGLGRSVVVRPTRRASAAAALTTSAMPSAVPVGELRLPVAVGAGSTTLLATLQDYAVAPAQRYDVCLAPPGGRCVTDSVAGGSGVHTSTALGRSSTVSSLYFYAGDVAPGRYDAVFSTAAVAVGRRLSAFALRVG